MLFIDGKVFGKDRHTSHQGYKDGSTSSDRDGVHRHSFDCLFRFEISNYGLSSFFLPLIWRV
mgnify:CR=1 FL=1